MVSFASKAGNNVRQDIKSASGGGAGYLRTFKDGKDCRVRFISDPEEWLKYREHYSQETKYFPCTQENDCPGCTSENERMQYASRKYIAQVIIVQEDGANDEGKVRAVKLTVDLANRLVNKADRNGGTLTNRDYTIIRIGNDKNTTYDVEVEDKSNVDLSKFEQVDVEAILNQMYESAWGSPSEKKEETQKTLRDELRAKSAEVKAAKETSVEEDDKPPF